MVQKRLRANDWVEIRSPREIEKTLAPDGCLDGLPFMPEMLSFCGRRFRVARLASKTCVEVPGFKYQMREFRNDDAVILEIDRCSGAAHGGCQRACVLFWKEAWLRKVEPGAPVNIVDLSLPSGWPKAMRTELEPGRYVCQSTELHNATQSLSRWRVIQKCFADVASGSRSPFEMARLVWVPLWRYFTPFLVRKIRVGTLKQTPLGTLGLQPGEWVTVNSEDEIVKTLDARYRNRGLTCDMGMRLNCGRKFKVRNRLDRLISESTGQLREVKGTVMLEGIHCLCEWFHVGGCPRADLAYWREIWLTRAEPKEDAVYKLGDPLLQQQQSSEEIATKDPKTSFPIDV